MIQVVNMQKVKVEVKDFEQVREMVSDLTLSGFSLSAVLEGGNWLIVAEKEIQPIQPTWKITSSPAYPQGTWISAENDAKGLEDD